jgi:hypothetical protein
VTADFAFAATAAVAATGSVSSCASVLSSVAVMTFSAAAAFRSLWLLEVYLLELSKPFKIIGQVLKYHGWLWFLRFVLQVFVEGFHSATEAILRLLMYMCWLFITSKLWLLFCADPRNVMCSHPQFNCVSHLTFSSKSKHVFGRLVHKPFGKPLQILYVQSKFN